MKILEVKSLEIPEIKVIKFQKFNDERGYFTEHFRESDLLKNPSIDFMDGIKFTQANQSYSKKDVVRGMHFQWSPPMGKLVRNISGHMVDLILDIRKDSPTYGKMIAYDLKDSKDENDSEWIWIPHGFGHGFFTLEDTITEYFCSAEYNPDGEAGISPFSKSIDWSLCAPKLREKFEEVSSNYVASEKDKKAIDFSNWKDSPHSENYIYSKLV